MSDDYFSSPSTTFIQSSGRDGFRESRQNESVALAWILASLKTYWYVGLAVSTLMMAGIVYKTLKEPHIYKSTIQIVIESKDSSIVIDKSANNISRNDSEDSLATLVQTLRSKTIIQKAVDIIPDRELKSSVDTVASNLNIQPVKDTSILSFTYTDTIPQRIVSTLNALSHVYIDYSIITKKASTDKSIDFINSQLPESRKRLEKISENIEQFRQKYRFFDPESSTNRIIEYRQQVITQLDTVTTQYDQTQKQYEELKKQLAEVGLRSDNVLNITILNQDNSYQELFKKLNELEVAYSQERLRFNDNNPLVVSAKGRRDQMLLLLRSRAQQVLKREVPETELTNGGIANFSNSLAQDLAKKRTEIATNLASQTAQYQSLYKVYQQIEAQLAQLPALQKQYTELQRQYNIYSQELTAFLQKLQELKIADAEQVRPWRLLDPPELPQSPISPDVPRQIGLGALGSLLVGVLAAMGLKKLDNRIDNPETVKSMSGMPILTLIPTMESFDQVSMRGGHFLQVAKNKNKNQSYWSFIEAIRILALGIRLVTDQEDNPTGKVIAITSASPKEGKSMIAFNTSVVLSQFGHRVLLVDGDLYQSSVTELCVNSPLFSSVNCSSKAGLTDAIAGVDNWQDLIKKAPQSKLDVLFSGSPSVNSISLLNSSRLVQLLEQWRQKYDYVVFDTPPILGVSDTRLIGSLVDGLIYVVSLRVARRRSIDLAVEAISSLQTPVLGLAINQVEDQYSRYSRYHQHYQPETTINSNLIG